VGDQRIAVATLATLLSLPAVLLVHELLRMRVHPGAGPRRDSMLGAMPEQECCLLSIWAKHRAAG
jgi:hypothetical protein